MKHKLKNITVVSITTLLTLFLSVPRANMATDSINDFFDRWYELATTYWTLSHSGYNTDGFRSSFVLPMTPIPPEDVEALRQETVATYQELTQKCIENVDGMTITQINTAHDRCDAALLAFLSDWKLDRSGTAILAYQARNEERATDLELARQSTPTPTASSTPIALTDPSTEVPPAGNTYHTRLTYYPPRTPSAAPTTSSPSATPIPSPTVATTSPVLTLNSFYDVSDATSYAYAIQFVKSRGIVEGFPDGTFKPKNTLTRAELLKMVLLSKYSDTSENGPSEAYSANCFSDIDSTEWYAKFVCFAKENSILNGYEDGTFRPNQTVTYIEALKIALNTLNFQPSTETTPWYDAFLSKADEVKAGISETKQNEPLTRAKMAELVTRLLKYKEEGLASMYLSGYQPLQSQASVK